MYTDKHKPEEVEGMAGGAEKATNASRSWNRFWINIALALIGIALFVGLVYCFPKWKELNRKVIPYSTTYHGTCLSNLDNINNAVYRFRARYGIFPESIDSLTTENNFKMPICPHGGTYYLDMSKIDIPGGFVSCSINGTMMDYDQHPKNWGLFSKWGLLTMALLILNIAFWVIVLTMKKWWVKAMLILIGVAIIMGLFIYIRQSFEADPNGYGGSCKDNLRTIDQAIMQYRAGNPTYPD